SRSTHLVASGESVMALKSAGASPMKPLGTNCSLTRNGRATAPLVVVPPLLVPPDPDAAPLDDAPPLLPLPPLDVAPDDPPPPFDDDDPGAEHATTHAATIANPPSPSFKRVVMMSVPPRVDPEARDGSFPVHVVDVESCGGRRRRRGHPAEAAEHVGVLRPLQRDFVAGPRRRE